MVLVLLLVTAAVYGVILLLKRRVGATPDDTESPIRVLAERNLGGSRDVYAVMIGRQVLILGGGDSGLHLITTVEDQDTIDELVLAHSTAAGDSRRTFGSVLSGMLGNFTVPGSASGSASGGRQSASAGAAKNSPDAGVGQFLKAQQNRLRQMR